MKKKAFNIIKVITLILYGLYLLETVFIAGMFTNIMFVALAGLLSIIYLVYSIIIKRNTDALLASTFILSIAVITKLLY